MRLLMTSPPKIVTIIHGLCHIIYAVQQVITSNQTTVPFFTFISMSRGQFLLFPFLVILQLITLFHNLQATKSSTHYQYGYKKKNIQSWPCTRHSSIGGGRGGVTLITVLFH